MSPHFRRREFVSGFTGSAGTAVITRDKALLWTDGRYFLQAEQASCASRRRCCHCCYCRCYYHEY